MAIPTSFYKPELGLPLNPGAENSIQNAAMGEEGHKLKNYRTLGAVIPTVAAGTLAADGSFIDEIVDINDQLLGFIDVSNVSAITIFTSVTLGTLTGVNIYIKYFDIYTPLQGFLAAFSGTVIGGDMVYTLKRSRFLIDQNAVVYCIPLPVLNFKALGIFIEGIGVNTGSSMIIKYARGWTQNIGIFSV